MDPLCMAQMLCEVWNEMGSRSDLAPPAAWIEVGERLQKKITAYILNEYEPCNPQGELPTWQHRSLGLAEIKCLCLLLKLDPKATSVSEFLYTVTTQLYGCAPGEVTMQEAAGLLGLHLPGDDELELPDLPLPDPPLTIINAGEPRPPFAVAGTELFRDESPELLCKYSLAEIQTGYYHVAAIVREPDPAEVDQVTTGRRRLLPLIPTAIHRNGKMIEVDPGPYYVPCQCHFCNRMGWIGRRQLAEHAGVAICPPCIPRLVGRTLSPAPAPQPAEQSTQQPQPQAHTEPDEQRPPEAGCLTSAQD